MSATECSTERGGEDVVPLPEGAPHRAGTVPDAVCDSAGAA
ncbi:hypothetical protein [Kocuria aegyptia]|uniref:Uncharacterized protein n=1 Tax=Kocuria aegyptia TaxID=330943 RepID=A0ABN2KYC1_9MICC